MVTLTKKQVLELQAALNSVGTLSGVKFAYAVARNKAKIKGEIEAIQAAQKASDEFVEYENKRLAIARKHAIKNEKGEFVYDTGENGQQMYTIENEEEFNKEFEALKTEYKQVLDGREQQIKDFEKLLEEEVEIDLYVLGISNVPESITAQQMSGILPMIEEAE